VNQVAVGAEPAFYAFVAQVPEDTAILQVFLSSRISGGGSQGSVYLDGLVLAAGEYVTTEPPAWDSGAGMTGSWGGASALNLLRNGRPAGLASSAALGGSFGRQGPSRSRKSFDDPVLAA
jgi:hypothetical protein